MKRKHFKIGVPLMAFLMAGAMAFTTSSSVQEEANLVTGYIFQNQQCKSTSMDCNELPGAQCTYLGLDVYRYQDAGGTSCSVPLSHRK